MSTRQPVRLIGTDADVIAVARVARRAIDADRTLARDLVPVLAGLHRSRRRARAASPRGSATPATPVPPAAPEIRGVVWSVATGAGVAAALLLAAVMFPPVRGFTVPLEVAVPLFTAAAVTAIVLLIGALVTASVPSPRQAYMGMVFAVIVGAAIIFSIGYRLIAGPMAKPALSTSERVLWFVSAASVLIALALLALRLRRRVRADHRAHGVSWSGDPSARAEARRLLADVHRVAARTPSGAAADEVAKAWSAGLGDPTDPATIAQARELGPVAWLAWAAYDGDYDLTPLRLG